MSVDGYSTGLGSLASASAVDRLQSALKQKEGELHNAQVCVCVLCVCRRVRACGYVMTSS